MPLVDRIASGVVTAVPPLIVVIAMWLGWMGNLLQWQDLLILALSYMVIGTGITVGFHRLLTHRSFKCHRVVRMGFAMLGSAAAEGPVIDWVATHRKHHQFSDVDGDPHSPHVGHGTGWRGALSGLVHAHVGWVFRDMEVADEQRYAKDLLADPLLRFVDRTFVLWVAAGLAAAFGLGVLLTGTVKGGLVALLWGGAARIFFMHHATFSINSLCHYFGRHDYDTGDYGPVYARWDSRSQAIIARADYIKRHKDCPSGSYALSQTESVSPGGPHGSWLVHYEIGGQRLTDYWFYTHRRWVFDLVLSNPSAVKLYRMTSQQYVTALGCAH
jgi:stearoyl-CoA desaturase (delta-9 desaturase)